MKKNKVYRLVSAALIAAIYVVLTMLSNVFGLAYGPIQFRFSEALMIFAAFTPAAIPGLTVGCLLANILSTVGAIDLVFGTFATFLASVLIYLCRNFKVVGFPVFSVIYTTIINAVIVGAEIVVFFIDEPFTMKLFLWNAFTVGLGELAVTVVGGIPLYFACEKTAVKKYLV